MSPSQEFLNKTVKSNVSLPYTIDPAADGLSAASGEYYVIKVEFASNPSSDVTVEAFVK